MVWTWEHDSLRSAVNTGETGVEAGTSGHVLSPRRPCAVGWRGTGLLGPCRTLGMAGACYMSACGTKAVCLRYRSQISTEAENIPPDLWLRCWSLNLPAPLPFCLNWILGILASFSHWDALRTWWNLFGLKNYSIILAIKIFHYECNETWNHMCFCRTLCFFVVMPCFKLCFCYWID